MTAECPVCHAPQDEGLMCHNCTTVLERELADVPAIVAELDVTLSRQSRIGSGGKGGLASERTPAHLGAMQAAEDLANTLTTWIRDITDDQWRPGIGIPTAHAAATHLLLEVVAIRRHPAADELHDEITDAVKQARRAVDRPADRQFLGTCYVPDDDEQPCMADLYAPPGSAYTTCRLCGITHDVVERQKWLLREAEDRLFSVREAAQIIGSYGHLRISESTIRSYISTNQLGYRGKVSGSSVVRLGDLLEVIAHHAAKDGVRKLGRAV